MARGGTPAAVRPASVEIGHVTCRAGPARGQGFGRERCMLLLWVTTPGSCPCTYTSYAKTLSKSTQILTWIAHSPFQSTPALLKILLSVLVPLITQILLFIPDLKKTVTVPIGHMSSNYAWVNSSLCKVLAHRFLAGFSQTGYEHPRTGNR
jgi:hypothetical protein